MTAYARDEDLPLAIRLTRTFLIYVAFLFTFLAALFTFLFVASFWPNTIPVPQSWSWLQAFSNWLVEIGVPIPAFVAIAAAFISIAFTSWRATRDLRERVIFSGPIIPHVGRSMFSPRWLTFLYSPPITRMTVDRDFIRFGGRAIKVRALSEIAFAVRDRRWAWQRLVDKIRPRLTEPSSFTGRGELAVLQITSAGSLITLAESEHPPYDQLRRAKRVIELAMAGNLLHTCVLSFDYVGAESTWSATPDLLGTDGKVLLTFNRSKPVEENDFHSPEQSFDWTAEACIDWLMFRLAGR